MNVRIKFHFFRQDGILHTKVVAQSKNFGGHFSFLLGVGGQGLNIQPNFQKEGGGGKSEIFNNKKKFLNEKDFFCHTSNTQMQNLNQEILTKNLFQLFLKYVMGLRMKNLNIMGVLGLQSDFQVGGMFAKPKTNQVYRGYCHLRGKAW